MWVFILLLLIGSTIIVTRLFRNGAREEMTAAGERGTLGTRQPALGTTAEASALGTRPSAPSPASAYPPAVAEQAGGACPSCGTETVPGAKFCGECGHRLVS